MRPRVSPLAVGLLGIFIFLLFVPLILNMLNYGNDYPAHIKSALALQTTGQFDRPRPQFLYHILFILLNTLIPSPQGGIAASVLGVLCYLALGFEILVLLSRLFYRMTPRIRLIVPILVTLLLMFVSSINFFTWPKLYFGYLVPYTYHNPTVVLLMPFALILFLFAARAFEGSKSGWKTLLVCALIAVASTLAKPNYAIALIPALVLVAVYYRIRKHPVDWRLLGAVILPVIAVLGWQFIFYQDQGMGGFEFAPFKVANLFSESNLLPKFLLSITFPVVVYLLYFKEARQTLPLNLAWLAFGVAAFYFYFFAEKNNWTDGNFFWGAEVTNMILFISSMIFLIRQNLVLWTERHFNMKFGVSAGLFALHFLGGLAFYLACLSPQWQAWL